MLARILNCYTITTLIRRASESCMRFLTYSSGAGILVWAVHGLYCLTWQNSVTSGDVADRMGFFPLKKVPPELASQLNGSNEPKVTIQVLPNDLID